LTKLAFEMLTMSLIFLFKEHVFVQYFQLFYPPTYWEFSYILAYKGWVRNLFPGFNFLEGMKFPTQVLNVFYYQIILNSWPQHWPNLTQIKKFLSYEAVFAQIGAVAFWQILRAVSKDVQARPESNITSRFFATYL
jgi:hypothetical protein